MVVSASARRLYARTASAADRNAWSVERDIAWYAIDRRRALERPEILASLRSAALIESYHPLNLARLLEATWDDVDASVVFSLELYDGFKHFHALRWYLDVVRHDPPITDAELVELRRGRKNVEVHGENLIEQLVAFMLSEHLSHYFFRRLGEKSTEPVLADLLSKISADEMRHAQSASDLIAKRIEDDRSVIPRVVEAARRFRRFGEEAMGTLAAGQPSDPIAIQTFARRIEGLCGVRQADHIGSGLLPEAAC